MAALEMLERFIIPTLEETGVSLGTGSYGEVVKMKMNGEAVAVKKLHAIFLDPGNEGWETKIRNFEEECVRYYNTCTHCTVKGSNVGDTYNRLCARMVWPFLQCTIMKYMS